MGPWTLEWVAVSNRCGLMSDEFGGYTLSVIIRHYYLRYICVNYDIYIYIGDCGNSQKLTSIIRDEVLSLQSQQTCQINVTDALRRLTTIGFVQKRNIP